MYLTISKKVQLNGLERMLDKEYIGNGLQVFSTMFTSGDNVDFDSLDNIPMLLGSYTPISKLAFLEDKFETSKFPSKRYYVWSFVDESISYGLMSDIHFMFDVFKYESILPEDQHRVGIRFYTVAEDNLPLLYKDSGTSFQDYEGYFLPVFDAALRLLE